MAWALAFPRWPDEEPSAAGGGSMPALGLGFGATRGGGCGSLVGYLVGLALGGRVGYALFKPLLGRDAVPIVGIVGIPIPRSRSRSMETIGGPVGGGRAEGVGQGGLGPPLSGGRTSLGGVSRQKTVWQLALHPPSPSPVSSPDLPLAPEDVATSMSPRKASFVVRPSKIKFK